MNLKIAVYCFIALSCWLTACNFSQNKKPGAPIDTTRQNNPYYSTTDSNKIDISNKDWNNILPGELYAVARQRGTERAFSGKYNNFKDTGTFYCAVCGNPLFASNGKFESSCGWPSFFEPITKGSLLYAADTSHGMKRSEVMCGRCKSHLGHVFEDGPPPTGLRYCINSVILDFTKANDVENKYADSLHAKK